MVLVQRRECDRKRRAHSKGQELRNSRANSSEKYGGIISSTLEGHRVRS